MRRVQIYLDDSQDEQLRRGAAAVGVTTSQLIREAIDAYLEPEEDEAKRLARFKAAVEEVAGKVP